MPKSKYIFILTIIIFQICFTQEKQLDSLEHILKVTISDSLKINLIEKIQVFYRKRDSKKHKLYISEGLKLSTKNKYTQKEGVFTREYGIYYKNKGLLDSSLIYYKKAEKLFKKIKDSSNYYTIIGSMANIYKRQGNYKKATNLFIETINYYESINDKNSNFNAQVSKLNLANVYVEMNQDKKAVNRYLSILKNEYSKTSKPLLNATYINLSGAYKKLKQLDSSLFYAKKSEKLLKGSKQYSSFANLYTNIGSIYEEENNYALAKQYFLEALKNYEKVENKPGIIKSYNNLGNIYLKLKEYSKSEKYLLDAQKLLRETKNINSLSHNYKMLITFYQNTGNYNKAFETQSALTKLNDSILSLENRKAIQEIETKYEVEKKTLETENANKEREIATIKSEKNQKRFLYTAVIGGLILLTLTFYFIAFRVKKKQQLITLKLNQVNKELTLEKQLKTSEIKAIKAQMNPHFIFNALNSIQDLILLKDVRNSNVYLGKFADLMRKTLDFSSKNEIYLTQEIELLELYLELEKLRFGDDFTATINCKINHNKLQEIQVPSLLFQPYIENAIKHGLLHKKDNKELAINLFLKETTLICEIIDNGVGRTKAQEIKKRREKSHFSFSTNANKKRIDLIRESTNKNITLTVIDLFDNNNTPSGTKVVFEFE